MRRFALIGVLVAAYAATVSVGSRGVTDHAAQSTPVLTRQVYRSVDEAASFRVACPAGWVATGGSAAASPHVQETAILESWEAGPRGWVFRAVAPREVSAVVTCIRSNRALGISLGEATKFARLPEGESLVTTILCRPGQKPVGAGFELEPAAQLLGKGIPPPIERITFTTMKPVAGGWRFGLVSYRSGTDVGLLVRCARASTGQVLKTRRVSRRVKAAPGGQRFTHRCPSGSSPLFAGWSGPRGASVRGTIGRYRTPTYRVVVSGPAVTLSLDLLCIENRAAG